MALQPNDEDIPASVVMRTILGGVFIKMKARDFEVNIGILKNANGEYEMEIVQQAWWTSIRKLYAEEKTGKAPFRIVIEMHIVGNSDCYLALQRAHDVNLAIEAVSLGSTPEDETLTFWKNSSTNGLPLRYPALANLSKRYSIRVKFDGAKLRIRISKPSNATSTKIVRTSYEKLWPI